jgi:hypothetical protein
MFVVMSLMAASAAISPLPRPLPAAPAGLCAGRGADGPNAECLWAVVVAVGKGECHFLPTQEAGCFFVASRREVEVNVLLPILDQDEAEA